MLESEKVKIIKHCCNVTYALLIRVIPVRPSKYPERWITACAYQALIMPLLLGFQLSTVFNNYLYALPIRVILVRPSKSPERWITGVGNAPKSAV